jgi:hypothetical protein
MKSTQRFASLALALALLLVATPLSGCGLIDAVTGNDSDLSDAQTTIPVSIDPKDEDLYSSWDSSNPTTIVLNGTTATVTGPGAKVSGGTITISAAGTYVVSGTLTDGSIVVNASNKDLVYLVLNGADITNKTGAAIYAPQCDKLILTLADGTQNKVTDGGAGFVYASVADEEPNAAVYVKDDLTINGNGALAVQAGFNNGIYSKDDLLVVSGTLTIDAKNHGLVGHDSVSIVDGVFSITSVGQGIRANKEGDTAAGWIILEGGTFKISATGDAIHATNGVTVLGGSFTIATKDDGIHSDTNLTINGGSIKITSSYEGLEAAHIVIAGGEIDIVSTDDGINAAGGNDGSGLRGPTPGGGYAAGGNYSITMSGGTVSINSRGDGFDSNGSISISGGTILSLINSQANGAMDCDGTLTITGGTLVYGGTAVEGVPTTGSTQSYVYLSATFASGATVRVEKDGKTLIEATLTMGCSMLAFSSPDIKAGETYNIYSGSTLVGSAVLSGQGGEGMGFGGGGAPGGGGRQPGTVPTLPGR